MKLGKQRIYDLPVSAMALLSGVSQEMERAARTRGEALPPPVRLQIGEPSFRTPEHIRQAAIEAIASEPQTYGPAAGWPWLRELLAAKIARVNGYTVTPDNIAITVGGTGAIQAALDATVGPGDEVLVSDPCWPHYLMQIVASGATAVRYPLDAASEWLPDVRHLERLVTPRTRLLIINTPGNPSGAVFPARVVGELLEFARRHDLYLLSDECYDEIIFEGQHISPATLLERGDMESGRFIGVYTFSKTYAMTGWRIGYVVAGEPLIKTITTVLNANHTSISTIVQRAAAAALSGPQDCVREMREAYRRRRDLAVSLLKHYNRYIYTPHGAFYALVDVTGPDGEQRRDQQFTLALLRECNVFVMPGYIFGSVSAPYVRVSLAAADEEIERGIHAICRFADQDLREHLAHAGIG
ncbi:MAG: aminotransferase class I/II-fold pyridoxal phosphate-dependent enzyme [Ktedonobacteraceae bacterium]|nr:aminotransferase class I/II-fold pyridoxal phosphate-dependent enzyme [Ktedonobacteraceae bacterium]